MGRKLQDLSQLLEKGMRVFLLVNITGTMNVKRRPARVVDVRRGAVEIRCEGETRTKIVRFKHIEIDPQELAAKESKKVAGPSGLPDDSGSAVAPEPTAAFPPQVLRAPPPRLVEPPAAVDDDLQAWLNMGHQMLAPMQARCRELEEELGALADERNQIEEDIRVRKHELDSLNAKQRVINSKIREIEAAS